MKVVTSIVLLNLAFASLIGCASARLNEGKALIVSEASVEATANTAAANAALMTPAQRARVKAAIDSADAAVVAAHAAYIASKGHPQ